MPRWIPTLLTFSDIRRICQESSADPGLHQSGMISSLKPELSADLNGKEFDFTFSDGTVLHYLFQDKTADWNDGSRSGHETVEVMPSTAEGVYLIHHLRTDQVPYGASTLIFDLKSNLVTFIRDELGTVHANRDVEREVLFGWSGQNQSETHQFSEKLVGNVIDWKFADQVKIHSMYEATNCCAFVSPPPPQVPEWEQYFITFNPSKYIRIRENLFAISFCAPGSSGMETTMLIDLEKMTAVGATFGIDSADRLRSYCFGAKGAHAPVGFIGHYSID